MSGRETFLNTVVRGKRLKDWNTNPIFSRRMSASSIVGQLGNILAVQDDNSRTSAYQAPHDMHQGGLARTGRTHDGDELPFLYGKRYTLQDHRLNAAGMVNLFNIIAGNNVLHLMHYYRPAAAPPPVTRTPPPPPPPPKIAAGLPRRRAPAKHLYRRQRCSRSNPLT